MVWTCSKNGRGKIAKRSCVVLKIVVLFSKLLCCFKIVVLFYVLFVLYRSMYCLCVNVYCHRVTTQLQLTNISYQVMKWRPPGRRKRGRPKLTWEEAIRGLMGEKGLMEEEWNDRGNWTKKIL